MTKFSKVVLIFILVLVLGLVGCADLGNVDNEEDYCDKFGDISFVCSSTSTSPAIRTFAMDEMYNQDTIDKLESPMDEDEYKYMFVEVKENIKLDDFAMWFYSENTSTSVKIDVFLADSKVSSYKADKNIDKFLGLYKCVYKHRVGGQVVEENLNFNFDGLGKVTDEGSHQSTYTVDSTNKNKVTFEMKYNENSVDYWYLYTCTFNETCTNVSVSKYDKNSQSEVYANNLNYIFQQDSEYSEGGLENKIGTFTFYLEAKKWDSCYVDLWKYLGNDVNTIDVKKNQYLYFRIVNNCPGAFRLGISRLSFKCTNVLFRI